MQNQSHIVVQELETAPAAFREGSRAAIGGGDPCCLLVLANTFVAKVSGSEKGVFWKRGLFRKVHFLEILENLEILEILENTQTVENKGEPDHFLEILENLEILEILSVKRPLS